MIPKFAFEFLVRRTEVLSFSYHVVSVGGFVVHTLFNYERSASSRLKTASKTCDDRSAAKVSQARTKWAELAAAYFRLWGRASEADRRANVLSVGFPRCP